MSSPVPGPVRVRFAPSPTGYLHVGGARTALFNWLFARHHGGQFILRIEDTDLERSTLEAEKGLLDDLRWLGLDWDEGPNYGGPHGPYRQSERTDLYKLIAHQLLDKGAAYPCFCTEEVLEAKRQQAEAEHRDHHYDGTCFRLTPEEVQRRVTAKEPHAIRVKAPPKDYGIDDLVRGRVEWKAETLGDFIILRSNGMPVYNFCVVVDDSEMEISHVIRAEEHLPNTHRQLILYEALGRKVPKFAHVSLILGADKTKLSKRHGATAVGQYALDGFLPDAMVNFLALLGWNEGTDAELYGREELLTKFDLARVGSSPGVFDHDKLRWMNGQHIRKLSLATLCGFLKPLLQKAYPDDSRLQDGTFLEKLSLLIQPTLVVLNDVATVSKPILYGASPENEEAASMLATPESPRLFAALVEAFQTIEWKKEIINEAMKATAKQVGVKGKALFMPIRVKLTGNCHGPDLLGILELLGREEVTRRMKA